MSLTMFYLNKKYSLMMNNLYLELIEYIEEDIFQYQLIFEIYLLIMN